MNDIKNVVLFLKLIVCLLVQQTFENVIHSNVLKYDSLDKSRLRQFEKLSIKLKKADLDLTLLSNCWTFNVILKSLTYANDKDSRLFTNRLLWSAIKKRGYGHYRLEKQLRNICTESCSILLSTDKYIIQHLIKQSNFSKNGIANN